MKYLPFVERSIQRLGYLKPECAPTLARLMDQLEGAHPRDVARSFRQTGTSLDKQTKKLHGLRANTDMTVEAMDSLTQRGLASPIAGIEVTLRDAAFAYFRHRTTAAPLPDGERAYSRFVLSHGVNPCPGCNRLAGTTIDPRDLEMIPPTDRAHEACSMSVSLEIDFTQRAIDAMRAREAARSAPEKKSLLSKLFGR